MTRISLTATRSDHQRVCTITEALVAEKASDARRNDRRREIHVLHENDADILQRMLNALQPSSYIRPHRHVNPAKPESLLLLQGSLGFIGFSDSGESSEFVLLSRETGVIGVDCRGGIWHTFFALQPDTVIFEVKSGPFDAKTDKEFAGWAPAENTPEGFRYLAQLEDRFRARFRLQDRQWRAG